MTGPTGAPGPSAVPSSGPSVPPGSSVPSGPSGVPVPSGPSASPAWLDEVMALALAQAELAAESQDVPVGAVLLGSDGAVLGAGRNHREALRDVTGHAEIAALRAASAAVGDWQLVGSTLVVTLEPCTMCAGALVQARVARLVFGAWDDKAGAAGSLWDVVRDRRLNHRPEVYGGVRAGECGKLLTDFFARRR